MSPLSVRAQRLLAAITNHWRIENSCYWVLDVAFGDDHSQTRKYSGNENFATLQDIALKLLKADTSAKIGVANKWPKAALNINRLIAVLATLC